MDRESKDSRVAHIAALERRVRTLKSELKTARKELYRQKSMIAPVSNVPVEVLGRIFLAGNEAAEPWSFLLPFLVSGVCKHWRSAAMQTPALWTSIGISATTVSRVGRLDILSDVLARSGALLVDCFFDLDGTPSLDLVGMLMDILEPHAPRWRSVKVLNTASDIVGLLIRPVARGWTPQLQSLSFTTVYRPGRRESLPQVRFEHFQSLSSLEFERYELGTGSAIQHFANVERIVLKGATVDLNTFMRFITSNAHSLQYLSWVDSTLTAPDEPVIRLPCGHVVLPNLSALVLSDASNAMTITATTSAPNLAELTMANEEDLCEVTTTTQWCARSYPGIKVLRLNLVANDFQSAVTVHHRIIAWLDAIPRIDHVSFEMLPRVRGQRDTFWIADIRCLPSTSPTATEGASLVQLERIVWHMRGGSPCAQLLVALRQNQLFPSIDVRASSWSEFRRTILEPEDLSLDGDGDFRLRVVA